MRLALFLASVLAATVWTLERHRGPLAWRGTMTAHLLRFALALHVLAACEPELLREVLAAEEAEG